VGDAPCAGKEKLRAGNNRPPFACQFTRNDRARIGHRDLADLQKEPALP